MRYFLLIATCWLPLLTWAQGATQTVRGTARDATARSPLPGATVTVPDLPGLGTTADADGRFRLPGVPVGRVRLQVSAVGYESLLLGEVTVTAGKEVVLDVALTESLTSLGEVQVVYRRRDDHTVPNNELATVSARPFSPQEANRYAGALGDPARMAQNFAGVSSVNDGRNDLVVRGNSPASLLWRLEGVNIPNPNHFGSQNTTSGPVSILNNNLLAKSDFLTGAFPAEYANALGSVFDLRLRKGNDEHHEFLGQVGFNGFEVGVEGPYSSHSKASYLLNYRYSIFSLLKRVGYRLPGTPEYQDFTFKTDIPVGTRGLLRAWTIGGRSTITFLGRDVDSTGTDVYGSESVNSYPRFGVGVAAVSYEHRLSDRTVGQLTVSASRASQLYAEDTLLLGRGREVLATLPAQDDRFRQDKLSAHLQLSRKASARNSFTAGAIVDLLRYDYASTALYPVRVVERDAAGSTALTQLYGQWKHRLSERLTLNAGLSALSFALNGRTVVEPRAGARYQLGPASTLALAYGLHSSLAPLLTYFYQSPQPGGTYALTNRELGFTRAHHLVLAYDRQLGASVHLRVEAYYQHLFAVPVERTASPYSGLTEGSSFDITNQGNLVNEGIGRNYGLELTLERSFSQGYYFLLTGSAFDSRYRGSDGVLRNTPFNTRYVANALAGREFRVGQHGHTVTLSVKATTAGGRYVTPLDYAASGLAHQAVYRLDQAYSQQLPAYFRADVKLSYKINRVHLTHELALDLQNVTNRQNVFQQAYNPRTNQLGTAYQQGLLPIPFYRLTF